MIADAALRQRWKYCGIEIIALTDAINARCSTFRGYKQRWILEQIA
ncbi:MAG: hypothetical protein HOQ35_18310 [Acidobacteriaceae bacterium]|nr:hypothetical protein [Acidobacteriaceae bacterium]